MKQQLLVPPVVAPPTRRADLKVGMVVRVRASERMLHGVHLKFPASKDALVTDLGETWARLQWGKGAWENIVSQCHSIPNLEIVDRRGK